MVKKFTFSSFTFKLNTFLLLGMILFTGAIQKVSAQDMGVVSVIAPSGPLCPNSNQTISVMIENFDTVATDFSITPVTITVNINGASTQSFNFSVNTGTLDVDSLLTVDVTTTADFSAAGTHLFNTYTMIAGDYNAANDTNNVHTLLVNALPTITINSSASAANACYGTSVTLSGAGAATYSWDNGIVDGVAFADTMTTNYTVTGVDTNGCSNTASVLINVNSLLMAPMVTSISTADSICSGDSVKLSGQGALSYSWTGGITDDVFFTPTASSTYEVTGIDASGCANTSEHTITFRQAPNVTIVSSSTVPHACLGTPLMLSGAGADFYSWDNGISDGVSFTDTVTTTYTVTGFTLNGCSATATITINVNDTLNAPTVTATASVASDSICPGDSIKLIGNGAFTYTWNNGVTNNTFFTPSGTTTYMVTGVDNSGCANIAPITITFRNLPIVGTTINPSSVVCTGTYVILYGTGASTYTWTGGAINGAPIGVSSPVTFTVTGTDAHGCKSTSTQSVATLPLPTVSLNPFTIIPCAQAAPFLLTGGSPLGGDYSGIGVDSANMFHPQSAGAVQGIFYTVTDSNGCSNTATQNMHVKDCTGIEENNDSQALNIYPNPNNGSFSLEMFNIAQGEITISIVDLQGKEVYSVKEKVTASLENHKINSTGIAKGFYYVKVNSADKMMVKKLIIE